MLNDFTLINLLARLKNLKYKTINDNCINYVEISADVFFMLPFDAKLMISKEEYLNMQLINNKHNFFFKG